MSLTYRVVTGDDPSYKMAPSLTVGAADFTGKLEADVLVLEPKEHFASQDDARVLAETFVRAWEIDAGLAIGRPEFKLRFDSAQVIDRKPTPGVHALSASLTAAVTVTASAHLLVNRGNYPPPPATFRVTPEVEALWARYLRYREGHEPLLSMAYACLTLLERGDGREVAAGVFGVQFEVLRRIGEITSTRGDALTARKMGAATGPLTTAEAAWLDAAIRALIRHLATRTDNMQLTMASLPPL